jgi:hypothetical protein
MVPIKVKRNPPQKVIHPIPSHNGIGSEEDSLLSVYFLHPETKIPKVTRMFKSDKHILRFKCKLISPTPSDMERNFILSVFCRDDTIQIFEIAERNSGRESGRFMERKKVKNPYTTRYYAERDFVVGNTIYVNKYVFKLLDCDEYTKKYMIDNPELFKDSDILAVVNRIRTAGAKERCLEEYTVSLLKTLDPQGRHFIGKDELINGFKR